MSKIMVEKTIVKKRSAAVKKTQALSDIKSWLTTLVPGITPTVHVNGKDYLSCIVAVDFGTPLTPFELSVDQATELPKRMKAVVKEILPNPVQDNDIRIWSDTNNGVWWAGTRHWS